MPNNRVFYASHGVKVGGTTVQGAQSVGVTTNYNLEQAFQLGQLAIYNNMIVDPNVEITVNKVLDGQETIWNLATGGGSIVSNANDQTTVVIGVGDDTAESLTSTAAITCTGMYISSLTYTFPVDGNFTEDITFVGNHKALEGSVSAPSVDSANVLRRQNFQLSSQTVLPSGLTNANLSSVTISADLGRESIYKLGQYAPFHRYVNFPLEITTAIEVTAQSVDTLELDIGTITCSADGMPPEETIVIALCSDGENDTYVFDLGNKNRLQSVEYGGGDTGGGNATITYNYVTYNTLSISG